MRLVRRRRLVVAVVLALTLVVAHASPARAAPPSIADQVIAAFGGRILEVPETRLDPTLTWLPFVPGAWRYCTDGRPTVLVLTNALPQDRDWEYAGAAACLEPALLAVHPVCAETGTAAVYLITHLAVIDFASWVRNARPQDIRTECYASRVLDTGRLW